MNPCIDEIEKLFIAIEATNMDYMLMRKYVNELDNCMARNPRSAFIQDKKSTMYYLNQYLDQQKHKKKWKNKLIKSSFFACRW